MGKQKQSFDLLVQSARNKSKKCPHCAGKGKRPYFESGWGFTSPKPCWQCEGTGTNAKCAPGRCGCEPKNGGQGENGS